MYIVLSNYLGMSYLHFQIILFLTTPLVGHSRINVQKADRRNTQAGLIRYPKIRLVSDGDTGPCTLMNSYMYIYRNNLLHSLKYNKFFKHTLFLKPPKTQIFQEKFVRKYNLLAINNIHS